MNTDPQFPSEPQLTPVEFAPPSIPEDAIGTIPPAPPTERLYTFFWPLLIILLTLNFSIGRDIVSLNKRMNAINEENAPIVGILSQAPKQTEFMDALRADILKLGQTDPYASDIAKTYFALPQTPKQDATATPPAK